jgi:hypothetical protein
LVFVEVSWWGEGSGRRIGKALRRAVMEGSLTSQKMKRWPRKK